MNPNVSILRPDGTVASERLDDTILVALQPLDEGAEHYFDLSRPHVLMPLKQLAGTRARPDGIISANKLMAQAAKGELSKRAPISIARRENDVWAVLDGNSTFVNASFSNWASIPCAIAEDVVPAAGG